MTLQDRCTAFAQAYAKWPASHPRLVQEQGRDVLYATWMCGQDYRNKTRYYGAYPAGYLARVMAFFPDALGSETLHVFSGSLPDGNYIRCDSHQPAELQCSVYDLGQTHAAGYEFRLILADPPYSKADAVRYGTPMIDRRRALSAIADVAAPGAHLVWLDVCWPQFRKTQWVTVGRITVIRSTNHRVRLATIFERAAA